MQVEQRNVLMVKVPAGEGVELATCRDYIIESLQKGVVVMKREWVYTLESLPISCGVAVAGGPPAAYTPAVPAVREQDGERAAQGPEKGAALLRESDAAQLAAQAERAEKQRILQRLRDYRTANGLGCLSAVAAKTRPRGAISAAVLRDVLNSSAPLPIEDWRKIDRALDRLAAEARKGAAEADG